MITIKIGSDEQDYRDYDKNWIAQMINRRKKDGQDSICIQVIIKENDFDMILSSGGCSKIGGGRKPNRHEAEIFALWEKKKLNTVDFSPGNLISFLNQLSHYL